MAGRLLTHIISQIAVHCSMMSYCYYRNHNTSNLGRFVQIKVCGSEINLPCTDTLVSTNLVFISPLISMNGGIESTPVKFGTVKLSPKFIVILHLGTELYLHEVT